MAFIFVLCLFASVIPVLFFRSDFIWLIDFSTGYADYNLEMKSIKQYLRTGDESNKKQFLGRDHAKK